MPHRYLRKQEIRESINKLLDSYQSEKDKERVSSQIASLFESHIDSLKDDYDKLEKIKHDLAERVKELGCLHQLSELVKDPQITTENLIKHATELIPPAWHYPEITCARIKLGDAEYRTSNYMDSAWKQSCEISYDNKAIGEVEVAYLEKKPVLDEGVFLKEERKLINTIADYLGQHYQNSRSKKMLQRSEENLRITLDSIGDAVIATDTEAHITRMNPIAEQLTGWSLKEAKGRKIQEVFKIHNAVTKAKAENPVFKVLQKGNVVGLANHTVLVAKDGKEYQIADSAAPIKNAKNEIAGVVMVFRDVTEDYEIQEAMRKREHKYKAIFENTGTASCILEKDGTITLANSKFEHLSGYSRRELEHKKTWMEFVHPEDLVWMQEQHKMRRKNRKKALTQYEFRFLNKNKELKHIFLSVDMIENTSQSVASLLDITGRKLVEQKVKENEQNLQITLDSIGDAVIATDRKGYITRMNPVAQKLTDWNISDAKGLALEKVFRIYNAITGEKAENPVNEVIKTGKIVGLANHTKLISKHGNEYQIADSGSPIMDEQGSISGVVLVFRDVTEDYKLRRQLKLNEERLSSLYNSMTEGVCIHELVFDDSGKAVNYKILDVNPEYEKILDLKKQDVINKLATDIYNSEGAPYLKEYSEVALGGEPYQFQTYFPGMDKHFSISVFQTEPNKFATVFKDISKQIKYENELNNQKQRLSYILEGTNAGTWEWNIQTGETVFNERWAEMLGYRLEELGKTTIDTWVKFTHPNDLEKAKNELDKHFNGESDIYQIEFRMRHKDGHWVWVADSGKLISRTQEGEPLMMFGTHLDISDRKLAEAREQEAIDKMSFAMEAAMEGSWQWDLTNDMVTFDRMGLQMLGFEEDYPPIHGNLWIKRIHPEEQELVAKKFNDYLSGKDKKYDVEFRIRKKDGSYIWVSSIAKIFEHDENGKPKLIIGIHRDISEKIELEQDLKKIQWLLDKESKKAHPKKYIPEYGDVTLLNTEQTILRHVGKEMLNLLAEDIMDLLDTSVAVYEKNGDYAFGVFESGWCQMMDAASRKLCNTEDNAKALTCGSWLCHENCWHDSGKEAIKTGQPTDIECVGGIRLYAEPIFAGNKVIGAINLGYGSPPEDPETLKLISERFKVPVEQLKKYAKEYKARPPFIIEAAKKRLKSIAEMIGTIVHREETQEALLESEQKFKSYIEHAPYGIFVTDYLGYYIDVNRTAEKLTGYNRDELLSMNISEIIAPGDRDQAKEHFKKLSHVKGALSTELQYIHKKKGNQYWTVTAVKMTDNKFLGFAFDTTERKLAELALRESRANLTSVIESTGDGIWSVNLKYELLTINKKFQEDFKNAFNVSLEKGMKITEYVSPQEKEKWIQRYERAFEGEHMQEVESYMLPQGEMYFEINVNPIYQDNRITGASVISRNITAQRQAATELEKSREQFNLAMNASRDGLFDWDLTTNNIYYSPGWKRMLGYEPEELPNDFSVWENLTKKEDREESWRRQKEVVERKRDRFEMEFKMKHKNGHWVDILSRAEALFDGNGKAVRMIGTHVDISELKKTEAQLIKAKEQAEESDRLKSAFLANMSHEIRTPMNGIMGFTQLLQESTPSGEKLQHYLGIIEKSGKRMLDTINDLVDISKIESGQVDVVKTNTDIRLMLEELHAFFSVEAARKNLDLSLNISLSPGLQIIHTDPEKVSSILTNLIKNSIKYTDQGKIEVICDHGDDFIRFRVKDTGIGISLSRQDAIFDRFIQGDPEDKDVREGSGLGLAITKSYVEMLDGTIELYSEPGKGSCFSITLPLEQKGNNNKSIATAEQEDTGDSLKEIKMLIAEDEDVSILYLKELFEPYCRQILYAQDGETTIKLAEANKDIDVILMDLKMPKLNGYEASKRIRQFNKDVIIIAQSAYAQDDIKQKALDAGCNDYISKPINRKELIRIIVNLLK